MQSSILISNHLIEVRLGHLLDNAFERTNQTQGCHSVCQIPLWSLMRLQIRWTSAAAAIVMDGATPQLACVRVRTERLVSRVVCEQEKQPEQKDLKHCWL